MRRGLTCLAILALSFIATWLDSTLSAGPLFTPTQIILAVCATIWGVLAIGAVGGLLTWRD